MNRLINFVFLYIMIISSFLSAFERDSLDILEDILDDSELSSIEMLEKAIEVPITFYRSAVDGEGKWEYITEVREDVAKKQGEVMQVAIDRGADLRGLMENKYPTLNIPFLYVHKELLSVHLGPINFTKLIFKGDIVSKLDKRQIDDIRMQQQSELLQIAMELDVDLTQTLGEWIKYINVRTLYMHRELLIRKFGASNFLMMVLYSYRPISGDESLELELVRMAIDRGAEVDYKTGGLSICREERGKEEFFEAGLGQMIMLQPQFALGQKYKNLRTEKSVEAKMPYVIHHIWLTHPSSAREIREVDIDNLIATKNIFARAPVQWEQIVWCNDPKIIPESVAKLGENGIQVKSIYEHKEDLKLFKFIESLIEDRAWGKASDTLRISLLEHFGGVYADLNYIFSREVTEEVHKYNFFTSTFKDDFIANFFIGSSPSHPILQEALKLIERNLTTPPIYTQGLDEHASTIIVTADPVYLAYYLRANQNGNKDVIYPSTSYYRRKKMGISRESIDRFTLESEEINTELNRLCPVKNFKNFIRSREVCGTEAHFIGYDSSDGRTWLNAK